MEEKIVFHCENVNLSYKTKQCLFNVNLDIYGCKNYDILIFSN